MHEHSKRDLQNAKTQVPTTDERKRARLTELTKLTTREKLLRIIKLIGDEGVGDGQLLRALIILEGLEPERD